MQRIKHQKVLPNVYKAEEVPTALSSSLPRNTNAKEPCEQPVKGTKPKCNNAQTNSENTKLPSRVKPTVIAPF